MLGKILLLFLFLPVIELAGLIWLGVETQWWVPIVLVLASGTLGTWLARHEGLRAWRRVHEELAVGRPPAKAALEAMLVFIAGVLLFVPGFLTDIVGILFLIPPTRRLVVQWLTRRFEHRYTFRATTYTSFETAEPVERDKIIDVRVIESRSSTDD